MLLNWSVESEPNIVQPHGQQAVQISAKCPNRWMMLGIIRWWVICWKRGRKVTLAHVLAHTHSNNRHWWRALVLQISFLGYHTLGMRCFQGQYFILIYILCLGFRLRSRRTSLILHRLKYHHHNWRFSLTLPAEDGVPFDAARHFVGR